MAQIIHFFVFNILHMVNRHVRFILLTLSELSINANQRQFSKMRHSLFSDLTRKTEITSYTVFHPYLRSKIRLE